jgi:hypothetical protein
LFARTAVAGRLRQNPVQVRVFGQIVAATPCNGAEQGKGRDFIGARAQAALHQQFCRFQPILIEGRIGVGKIRRIGRQPSVVGVGPIGRDRLALEQPLLRQVAPGVSETGIQLNCALEGCGRIASAVASCVGAPKFQVHDRRCGVGAGQGLDDSKRAGRVAEPPIRGAQQQTCCFVPGVTQKHGAGIACRRCRVGLEQHRGAHEC